MTVRPDAFPDTVSQPVRQLIEEFYRLSNAASSHTENEKGMYPPTYLTVQYVVDKDSLENWSNILHHR